MNFFYFLCNEINNKTFLIETDFFSSLKYNCVIKEAQKVRRKRTKNLINLNINGRDAILSLLESFRVYFRDNVHSVRK